MRYSRVLLAIALVCGVTIACRPAQQQAAGDVSPIVAPVLLHVENSNFADVTVYAVNNGVSRRIGLVTGNGEALFSLDRSYFPSLKINLVALPIGGFGRALSGSLAVSPGDEVRFFIAPALNQSYAVVMPQPESFTSEMLRASARHREAR